MKEQADLFSGEHGMLFGDKFQNFVVKMVKTRQNSEDLFKSMNKGKLQPLHHDPFSQKIISDGGEGCRTSFFLLRRPDPDNGVASTSCHRQGSSGKNSLQKLPFLQHTSRYFL